MSAGRTQGVAGKLHAFKKSRNVMEYPSVFTYVERITMYTG